ncbi:MAG: ECF transporter S component [Chloroflexi bacterium]|nr:ECF transporter S component [Chloroflexota bacterium]
MTTTQHPDRGWRLVDIVVAAVIAAAFGIVFLAWNAFYAFTTPLFVALPPAQAVLYGVWLLPAVLVALIVRRPGAAFFGGFVAAAFSVILGSPYGADALLSGALQGGGAEIAFAIALYRRWDLATAMLAGALAGVAAVVHDIPIYFAGTGIDVWVVYGIATVFSGAVLAGIGAWLLLRALVATGVLGQFEVGRDQSEV